MSIQQILKDWANETKDNNLSKENQDLWYKYVRQIRAFIVEHGSDFQPERPTSLGGVSDKVWPSLQREMRVKHVLDNAQKYYKGELK